MRRFFISNKSTTLHENLKQADKKNYFVEAFEALNTLYEADNNSQESSATKAKYTAPTFDKVDKSEEIATAEAILAELKDSDYENFVNILNSDGKSAAFLRYLRQHYRFGDDSIGTIKAAKPQISTISCDKLIPTQENISLKKSLDIIADEEKEAWGIKIIKTPTEAFTTPTVTYASKYIIDGHHRWSKAYALNGPSSKIKVLNFPAIEGVSWEDMLKAVQLAIVTMKPDAKLVNPVGNDNMLADDGTAAEKYYVENARDAIVQVMRELGRGDTKEEQGKQIHKNVAAMGSTNAPVSGAKPREFMPQMDDAGKAQGKIEASGIIDITA